jgi:hypothetical protein
MLGVMYTECHYAVSCILSVIMLSVIMLSVITLSVIMLIVIMLSVVAPQDVLHSKGRLHKHHTRLTDLAKCKLSCFFATTINYEKVVHSGTMCQPVIKTLLWL